MLMQVKMESNLCSPLHTHTCIQPQKETHMPGSVIFKVDCSSFNSAHTSWYKCHTCDFFFSQLCFIANKNTFFILSLEKQSSQILLDVFIKTKPKGNINVKQFNAAEEISENGLSDGRVDYKVTHSS